MDETIFLATQGFIGIISLGVLEALKRAGLPTQYAPIVSIFVGALSGLFGAWVLLDISLPIGMAAGVLSGLTASGAYDTQKTLRKKD